MLIQRSTAQFIKYIQSTRKKHDTRNQKTERFYHLTLARKTSGMISTKEIKVGCLTYDASES